MYGSLTSEWLFSRFSSLQSHSSLFPARRFRLWVRVWIIGLFTVICMRGDFLLSFLVEGGVDMGLGLDEGFVLAVCCVLCCGFELRS